MMALKGEIMDLLTLLVIVLVIVLVLGLVGGRGFRRW